MSKSDIKIAVVSDIHGNLPALKAVIADIKEQGVTEVWCLGDVFGYGPQPNECVEMLAALPLKAVAGNHDLGVTGRLDISGFNAPGQIAVKWQARRLTPLSLDYLKDLESRRLVTLAADGASYTLVHGSPRDPVWEYIMTAATAAENLSFSATDICFFGHTHLPVVYEAGADGVVTAVSAATGRQYELSAPGRRRLINPGSVGQPRDGDSRAAYGIFRPREKRWEFRRLDYPLAETQALIRRAGLPLFLAERLAQGI